MKRLIAISSLTLLCGLASAAQYLGWSTGYYTDWSGKSPASLPWKSYTHMCYFSLMPNSSGALSGVSASAAKAFVAEAHKNGVKAIICVGGDGTDGNFNTATLNATARANLVKNIVDFVDANGFDGVDMDWESKSESAARVTQFKNFHQEIRTGLDKLTPRRIMTAAIADWYPKCSASLYGICDQLNAMSYWSHVAQIPGFMSGLIKAGIPKASLGVGMGFDTDGEVGNDLKDCVAKYHYTMENGYGGMMVWEVTRSNKDIQDSLATYVNHSVVGIRSQARSRGDATLSINGEGRLRYTATGAALPVDMRQAGAYIMNLTVTAGGTGARAAAGR
jgi:coenzyme F420-reducing hydrogenase delta subunit